MTVAAITFDLDNTLWAVEPVLRHAERAQQVGEVRGGRVAFGVRIGREDDLADPSILHSPLEVGDARGAGRTGYRTLGDEAADELVADRIDSRVR